MPLTDQQIEDILNSAAPKRESGLQKYVLSPLGKTLDVLDTGLNIVTVGAKPFFTAIDPKLEQVYQEKGLNIVPSDLIEKLIPNKIVAPIVGFAADVAGDPLTYLAGIGGLTKYGEASKAISSLRAVGKEVSLTSKIAKTVAKVKGVAEPTEELIKGTALAPTLMDQANIGQRALVSFGVPFTGKEILQVKGARILGMAEKVSKDIAESNFGKAFNAIFSTQTSNPNFSKFEKSLKTLALYRAGLERTTSLDYGKEIHKLAKGVGKTPEEMNRLVTYLGEHVPVGDVPADALLELDKGNIYNQIIYNRENLEKVIKSIPGQDILSTSEKGKLYRNLARTMKNYQSATNVYTTAFKQLPEALRTDFANLSTRQATMSVLKYVRGDKYEFADLGKVLKVFTKTGDEEAALKEFIGNTEYERILKQHNEFMKGELAPNIPAATEYENMKFTLSRILSHVDHSFANYYSIYQSNKDYLKKVNPSVFSIMEKIASNDNWKVERLVEQFHQPLQEARRNPQAWDIAQRARKEYQRILQAELDAGGKTDQFIGNISYFPHVPTREVRDFLEKYKGFKGATRQWTAEHSSMLQRQFMNINTGKVEEAFNIGWINATQRKALLGPNGLDYLHSKTVEGIMGTGIKKGVDNTFSKEFADKLISYMGVDQVNAMSRNGRLKFLGGRSFDKFFDDNPANQLLIRGLRGARAITGMELFQGSKPWGTVVPKEVTVPPPGMMFVKADELKGIAFPEDIAKHLDAYHEAVQLPAAAHPFLNLFDDVQNGWKAWTLSIFPAYHFRNIVGNLWNNYLAGLDPITGGRYYKLATAIQRGKPIEIVTAAGERLTGEQLLKEAMQHAGTNLGQWRGDLLKYYGEEVKGLQRLSDNKVVNFGLKVGNALENNAKIAHYVWQREKGLSAIDAAASVKKYLFDYTDLTNTERELFKRILPFYTWCFDKKTEILTTRGWKRYNEVSIGDLAINVNIATQEVEFQKINDIGLFDYDGELIHWKNRNIDMLMTPNHRCIYHTRSGSRNGEWSKLGWRIKPAQLFSGLEWIPLASKGWKGIKEEIFDDDFVELLGWVITEGSYNHSYVNITQSERKHASRIRALLNRLGFSYKECIRKNSDIVDFRINTNYPILSEIPDKRLYPELLMKLTRKQLELLYNVMMMGDGHTDKVGSSTFYQCDFVTVDSFQMLCSLIGKPSRKVLRKINKDWKRFSYKSIYTVKAKSIDYTSFFSKNYIRYKGKVWCPNTKNGTIIIRRNGKVMLTGQTRKNIPLQLEALLAHPRKAVGVLKIKNAYETDYDGQPDERLLPDWMVRNFPVRARKSPKTGNFEYFLLGSWLPLADIDKLFEPDKFFENMLTPLLKEPIQQLANRDFYTGQEIDRGNEYERLATLHLPKRASHALRNIRLISEIDKALTSETDISGKILASLTGKLYPFNEEQAKAFKEREFKDQKSNLRYQLKRSRRKGDTKEEDRVLNELERLQKKKQEVLQ